MLLDYYPTSRSRQIVVASLFLLICLTLFFGFEFPDDRRFWADVQDAGHPLLFGVMSIALQVLVNHFLPKIKNQMGKSLLAWSTATLIGVVTELIQGVIGRDAEVLDVVRDALGAAGFLIFFATYTLYPSASESKSATLWSRNHKLLRYLAAVLVLIPAIPSGIWLSAYMKRDIAVPVICDFNSPLLRRFVEKENSTLQIVSPPANWHQAEKEKVGKVTFRAAADTARDYKGLTGFFMEEPYPDWSKYKVFKAPLYSELDTCVKLIFRIEDLEDQTVNTFADRFNDTLTVCPGLNQIVVSVQRILDGPTTRQMDLKHIWIVHFFMAAPREDLSLYFGTMFLEK